MTSSWTWISRTLLLLSVTYERPVSAQSGEEEGEVGFFGGGMGGGGMGYGDYDEDLPMDAGIRYRLGFNVCQRFKRDGSVRAVQYDECTSFCCGGQVYQNMTGLDCCGSSFYGRPYMKRYQRCCQWWTGHGRAFPWFAFRGTAGCCGANLVFWGVQRCCYGDLAPPQIYDPRRHLCCNAARVSIRTMYPWQSSCCGERTSFDHRLQSCPCNDGHVINAPNSRSGCCKTEEGWGTAYNKKEQVCCNGQVADISEAFCCADKHLGKIGEQVCCDGELVDIDTPDKRKTECCAGVAYDPERRLCCDDKTVAILNGQNQCCKDTPYDEQHSLCCRGTLWNKELYGTECCGSYAFFPDKGNFCCQDNVLLIEMYGGDACCGTDGDMSYYYKDGGDVVCCEGYMSLISENGDTCCREQPYFTSSGVCCDGEVFDKFLGDTCCNGSPYFQSGMGAQRKTICCDSGPFGPFLEPSCCNGVGYDVRGGQVCCMGTVFGVFRQPACCVDIGYDVASHQCCGGAVKPNPEGATQAGCCGQTPYDKTSELCCNDVIYPVPIDVPVSRARCCGLYEVYDPESQLCCSGVVFTKTSRYTSKCCGEIMYDETEKKCCEVEDNLRLPSLYDYEYGEDSECCGNVLYNSREEYCCDGFLQPNEYDETECCNGIAFDRTRKVCCRGRLQEIGGIPWQRAECCGPVCMYRGPQRCCMDRVYIRNERSNKTCEEW